MSKVRYAGGPPGHVVVRDSESKRVNAAFTGAGGSAKSAAASKPAPLLRWRIHRDVPTLASRHVDVITRSGRRSPSTSASWTSAHAGGLGNGKSNRVGVASNPVPRFSYTRHASGPIVVSSQA